MIARPSLETLLLLLYGSINAPGSLLAFLAELSRITESHIGTVITHDYRSGRGTIPAIVGVPADAIAAYEARYSSENVWMQRIAETLGVGSLNNSDEFLPLAELRRTVFWQEYLSLVDVDHCVGITGALDEHNAAQLSLCRSASVGRFTNDELQFCHALKPHWVNVCQIRRRLGTLHNEVTTLGAAIDRVGVAVLILDMDCNIHRTNYAADQLVARGDVLVRRSNRLAARQSSDRQQLQEAIRNACSDTATSLPKAARLVLQDSSGTPAALVSVRPVSFADALSRTSSRQAIVFIRSLSSSRNSALADALIELFQLTPAEARLAVELHQNADLATAAQQVGATVATTRSRLKVVFQKVGVHGQPALQRLLSRIEEVLGA